MTTQHDRDGEPTPRAELPPADEVNDLDRVARGKGARRVFGTHDDGSIDLDRDRTSRELQMLEQLTHGHVVRNAPLLAVQGHDHLAENLARLASPSPRALHEIPWLPRNSIGPIPSSRPSK